MDIEYYDNLSDDGALHKWPSDGAKLRCGKNDDRDDISGHAGYATSLLMRVQAKGGEISAALDAQGTFKHTSEYAKNTPLNLIVTAFAEVEQNMARQWQRHLNGQTVAVIDGEGRRLVDQAASGLFTHMKSYSNALRDGRIGEIAPVEDDLPADINDVTANSAMIADFLGVT